MAGIDTQLLADEGDLARLGVMAASLNTVSSAVRLANLRRASGEVLAAYDTRMTLPLAQWGDFTRGLVCDIASFRILTGPRGLNPATADGKVLADNYERAMKILDAIADLEIKAPRLDPDCIDSTESLDEKGPLGLTEGGALDQADGWTQTHTMPSGVRFF